MARQTAQHPQKPRKLIEGSLQDATVKVKSVIHGNTKQLAQGNVGEKKTVSISGVFKHPKKVSRQKKHGTDGHKETKPSKLDFAAVISEGLRVAGKGVESDRKDELDKVHRGFTQIINNARLEDKRFLQSIEEQTESLTSILSEEQIETQFTLDGKRMKQIVQMGPRVRMFEEKIINESAKLADAWKQWEALQDDFVALGSEVFGVEAFPNDVKWGEQQGYRKQIELLALEHGKRVEEMTEELELIGREAIQKMKLSEKDLAAAQKVEQMKLLAQMFAD